MYEPHDCRPFYACGPLQVDRLSLVQAVLGYTRRGEMGKDA